MRTGRDGWASKRRSKKATWNSSQYGTFEFNASTTLHLLTLQPRRSNSLFWIFLQLFPLPKKANRYRTPIAAALQPALACLTALLAASFLLLRAFAPSLLSLSLRSLSLSVCCCGACLAEPRKGRGSVSKKTEVPVAKMGSAQIWNAHRLHANERSPNNNDELPMSSHRSGL